MKELHVPSVFSGSYTASFFSQLQMTDIFAVLLIILLSGLFSILTVSYVKTRKKLQKATMVSNQVKPPIQQSKIVCVRCKTENRLGASFCRSCGAQLGPPVIGCPSCGASNSIEARFCRKCGKPLK
jgi:ribosomal protein L40E